VSYLLLEPRDLLIVSLCLLNLKDEGEFTNKPFIRNPSFVITNMEPFAAFFIVLTITVIFTMVTVGIFAIFHVLYQRKSTPLERRLWGIRFDNF
jgi:hypothetical protein